MRRSRTWEKILRRIVLAFLAVAPLALVLHSPAALRGDDGAAKSDADKAGEPKVNVTWDLAGWHTSSEDSFDYVGSAKPVLTKQKKLLDKSIIAAGIGVGGRATSKEDKKYQSYLKAATKGFHAGLGINAVMKPVAVTINNVEYQKLILSESDNVVETLVGIENGILVSYWFVGPPAEVKGFEAGVGQAKISLDK